MTRKLDTVCRKYLKFSLCLKATAVAAYCFHHCGAVGTMPPILGVEDFNGSQSLDRAYSPVTLSHDWSKVGRLILMYFCTFYGSLMNFYFITSFFVEVSLQKSENVYLACVGLADLMITVGVNFVSSVVILSSEWDNIFVCKALQLVGLTSTYCYNIYFTFVAVENYFRICRPKEEHVAYASMRVDIICILIFGVSMALSGVGVYLDLDYDYCERKHYGDFYFRMTTMVLFQAIPALLIVICLFAASCTVKRRARRLIQYKRSKMYELDYSITAINITAYFLFIMAWAPYIIVVHQFPSTSDAVYYNMIAIGLFRSSVTSTVYGIFNRNFRRAYGHLVNYCCCKSSLSSNRHRRVTRYKSTLGDVRVHIMHHAVASNAHRGVSFVQETQDL